MHLCAGLTGASWIMEPFGEIDANFSLQLSSRTQSAKISNKKLSPKINVKNIKTGVSSFKFSMTEATGPTSYGVSKLKRKLHRVV